MDPRDRECPLDVELLLLSICIEDNVMFGLARNVGLSPTFRSFSLRPFLLQIILIYFNDKESYCFIFIIHH